MPSCSATTIARKRRATRPSLERARSLGIPRGGVERPGVCHARAAGTAGRLHLRAPQDHAARGGTPAGAQFRTPRQDSRGDGAACSPIAPRPLPHTLEISSRLEFTLSDLGYEFPRYPVPEGQTMISFLRARVDEGARFRYQPYHESARRQIARELALIEKLGLAGYFLIVWDIARFCRENGILAQGRGSAANSAVCYALQITAVDPVGMDLLFERFLSEERGEWPDIDIDLPSGAKRERAIQYVYQRFGKAGRGHDRQRDHLSRPFGGARGGQGAGLRGLVARPALRPGARVGMERPRRHHRAPVRRGRLRPRTTRACANFASCTRWRRICRATSGSTPAAW